MRILYIDLDCLRPDHIGAYGYERETTPNIDSVARNGVIFTHAYCSNSPCVPSRASLFSGRFGINNGIVTHHGSGSQFRPTSRPTLAEHLWHNGFKTISFSSFLDRHSAWWYACGWQELHTHTQKRGQETADEVNEAFLPWLRRYAAEDNWFIHLHYWDCHSHYRLSEQWANHEWSQPAPSWPDEEAIAKNLEFYGPRTALDLWTRYGAWPGGEDKSSFPYMPDAVRTRADFEKLINGYDNAIRYADYHVGQVLDLLADEKLLDDTAIIISGDHGDSFGEHGQYMDHGIANEAVHRIPMIVRWPGMAKGAQCDAMIYGLDLGPTLCELLGLQTPERWDGRSFAPALRGEDFVGWPYQVWDHGIYTLTRAVRTRDWLLIHILHPGCYPYDEPVLLHNMMRDPHQTVNLAHERPDIVAELNNHLTEWRHSQIAKGCASDPLEQMVREGVFLYYTPEEMIDRLLRTGRGGVVSSFKERIERFHPGRFDEFDPRTARSKVGH
jgi:arylsulfatase A-like enzyme